jgi:hypothetical protein
MRSCSQPMTKPSSSALPVVVLIGALKPCWLSSGPVTLISEGRTLAHALASTTRHERNSTRRMTYQHLDGRISRGTKQTASCHDSQAVNAIISEAVRSSQYRRGTASSTAACWRNKSCRYTIPPQASTQIWLDVLLAGRV